MTRVVLFLTCRALRVLRFFIDRASKVKGSCIALRPCNSCSDESNFAPSEIRPPLDPPEYLVWSASDVKHPFLAPSLGQTSVYTQEVLRLLIDRVAGTRFPNCILLHCTSKLSGGALDGRICN